MEKKFEIGCKGCLLPVEDGILEGVPSLHHHQLVRCGLCRKGRGLLIGSTFFTIPDLLSSKRESDGWRKVDSIEGQRAHFILSQIIHNEDEWNPTNGIEFVFPEIEDHVKLLWTKGQAIGFYSLKLKGTFDLETMNLYKMNTVDTIFIRSSHQRLGFASTALKDIRLDFPNEKIGFSSPLTQSMREVLRKHLKENREDRLLFWETTDSFGTHGNARNVWLTLQRSKIILTPATIEKDGINILTS